MKTKKLSKKQIRIKKMSKKRKKKIIKDLLDVKERLHEQILKLSGWNCVGIEPFYSIVGRWDCKKSPCGLCCYDHYLDKAHNYCVYCGNPEERK